MQTKHRKKKDQLCTSMSELKHVPRSNFANPFLWTVCVSEMSTVHSGHLFSIVVDRFCVVL